MFVDFRRGIDFDFCEIDIFAFVIEKTMGIFGPSHSLDFYTIKRVRRVPQK